MHAVRHRSFYPSPSPDFRRKPKRQRSSAPKRSIGEKIANRSAEQHLDRQFFEFLFVRRLLQLKMIRVHPPTGADNFETSRAWMKRTPEHNAQVCTGEECTLNMRTRRTGHHL